MRTYTPDPDARFFQAGSLKMGALCWGPDDGPLVILVHGFPDTARTWDRVGPAIAALGYRVVAPWTRGYAPTAIPEDRVYDSDTLGRDLIALIDALGAETATLVGHDWGASAVYSATGLHPERVSRMCTVAIPHPSSIKPTPKLMWGARHFLTFRFPGAEGRFAADDFAGIRTMYERWSPGFAWPEEEFESARNCYTAEGALTAAFDYYRAMTPRPPAGHRTRIKVPSLVIGGRSDGVATEANFLGCRSWFTQEVQIEMVPGGHFLHREHPEEFLEVLTGWLGPARAAESPAQ